MKLTQPRANPSRRERSRYGSWLVLLAAVACGPAPVAPALYSPSQPSSPPPPAVSAVTAPSVARRPDATAEYTSTVRADNQTTLGASAVPFARYLNAMHIRIHPLFSDA
jgi:hypothetical protein